MTIVVSMFRIITTMSSPDFQLFSSLRYDPLLLPLTVNTDMWEDSTEIKFFSPFYMAYYHRDRMLQAAEYFGWTAAADKIRDYNGFSLLLTKLNEAIDVESKPHPFRVRTLLDHDGTITIEKAPTPEVSRYTLYPERLPPPRSTEQPKVSPLTGGALMLGDDDSLPSDPPRGEPWDVLPDTARTAPSPYTSYKTTSREMYMSARERVGIKNMTDKKEVLIVSEKEGEIMEGSLTTIYLWRNGKWTTPPVESGGQVGTTRRWALKMGWCVEGVVKVDELVDGEECWISNGVRGFQLGRIKLA